MQKSGAKIVPVSFYRKKDLSGYDLYVEDCWDNFPSNDIYQDALRYNQWLEQKIKNAPEQYLWQHRRYKTCKKGQEYLYRIKK